MTTSFTQIYVRLSEPSLVFAGRQSIFSGENADTKGQAPKLPAFLFLETLGIDVFSY
jgi:hypothetical protein